MNYLVLIDEIDVLASLYDKVLVPSAVMYELLAEGASQYVNEWASSPPAWLEILEVTWIPTIPLIPLGRGERDALEVAARLNIPNVLIDEYPGRTLAKAMSFEVIGTLGVLRDAAFAGLVDLELCLVKLKKTNFRASELLYEQIRTSYATRPRGHKS